MKCPRLGCMTHIYADSEVELYHEFASHFMLAHNKTLGQDEVEYQVRLASQMDQQRLKSTGGPEPIKHDGSLMHN